MAGPNGELDWHMVDDEVHWHMNEWIGQAGLFIEGRVTYELMADYWPTADADPASPPVIVEFARIWREMPKLVFSRTLEHAEWNARVVREVVPDEIVALKQQSGGDIVLGGADVAKPFIRHDLIDEYRCYVHPIIIGRGMPMFHSSERMLPLQLAETRTFGNGVVLLRYDRAGARGNPSEAG
jgi:dihydrofolate reductase